MPNTESVTSVKSLTSHIPPGQFFRYLMVGAVNTVFGFGCYAALTALLQPRLSHGYIVANLLAGLINITFSYLGYKWFVFKTKGNYLREWTRAVAVYSTAILLGTALLPVLVFLIRHTTRFDSAAPYIAGAVLIGFTTIYSFLGHRHFSFRSSEPDSLS